MTAIDMPFIERNLQEESFRQKDNREKTPVLPWKAIKESSFTEQTCETPERIKEKAAPFKHDQSNNFSVLWQLQAHSEITLKRYYLLSAQKMMMGMWSAVLVAGSCNGYSTLRQIFKSFTKLNPFPSVCNLQALPFSSVFTHLISVFLSSGI